MSAAAAAATVDGNGVASTSSNDLVINEGFPALNNFQLQKGEKEPDGISKDPVPRYPFASFPSAVSIDDSQLDEIVADCDAAFTARTKEDSVAYSSGATFFMPASIKPRCALEQLAIDIFEAHTKGLEPGKDFDLERSGAEWWTLVLDTTSASEEGKEDKDNDGDDSQSSEEEDDEVGMHFDADYGLEEQLPNYMLHPRVATVTYFSNVGVPTLILNKKSPPPTDADKKSLGGNIEQGWLSCPMVGKHIAFDGRLLHGAPGTFFPSSSSHATPVNADDETEPTTKRRKLENGEKEDLKESTEAVETKRISFMVNVWLNHCPIDAELLDDTLCSQMKTKWEYNEKNKNGSMLKGDAAYTQAMTWVLQDVDKPSELGKEELKFAENESDWAGTDEAVICSREVDLKYCAKMNDLHSISKKANGVDGKSLEIKFGPKTLHLEVGKEAQDSDDEDE